MKSKLLLAGLVVLVAIGIASFLFIASTNYYYSQTDDDNDGLVPIAQNNTGSSNGSTNGNNASTGNTGNDASGKVTLDQLAQHGTKDDCWVVYKGKVYDLTPYLPVHPGGVGRISPSCGNTGFEKAFEGRHGTSKVAIFMRVTTYKGELA